MPPVLTRRDLGAAAVMAAASYLTAMFTAPTGPEHAALFLAASVGVIAAGRLADRLWESTTAPALRIAGPGLRAAARYPFRLLGGGIAFAAVLLAAKRAGFVPVRDIPAIGIFATGAALSAGYHIIADAWKYSRGPGRPAGKTTAGGAEDDEGRTA